MAKLREYGEHVGKLGDKHMGTYLKKYGKLLFEWGK
jgi:hypothetical protein